MRSLLEIGIGGVTSVSGYETPSGGQSVRMWQDYFPNATIVGLDVEHKHVSGRRIVVERGSQADEAVLTRVAVEHGPFDVIVDDGSHVGSDVWASFEVLFAHVRPGGVYVIEDLAMAYAVDHEGGPPGTPRTQSALLGSLVDAVLRAHWQPQPHTTPPEVAELHVYDQIAFIYRA